MKEEGKLPKVITQRHEGTKKITENEIGELAGFAMIIRKTNQAFGALLLTCVAA